MENIEILKEKKLNYLISAWLKPKELTQAILEEKIKIPIALIISIGGIFSTLDKSAGRGAGENLNWLIIILIALFLGPISEYITINIASCYLEWTSKIFKNETNLENIKASFYVLNITRIPLLVITILNIIVFGEDYFKKTSAKMDSMPFVYYPIIGIGFILAIWSIINFVKSMAFIQKWSFWKTIVYLIVSLLIIIAPFAILFLVMFKK